MADTAEELQAELEGLGGHEFMRRVSLRAEEWAGIPMPLNGFRLVVEPRYPWRELITTMNDETKADEGGLRPGERIRNRWFSKRRGCYVWVIENATRIHAETLPRREHTDKLTFWLQTAGASQAWDVEAELRAQEKLAELIKPHLFDMYRLTGCFVESSKRSRLIYLFRRSRPTIALAPVRRDLGEAGESLKALAVLCLHPIGFYEGSWAGVMVPTDDVIAHLLMMRADEHLFWRMANHHQPDTAEAGI